MRVIENGAKLGDERLDPFLTGAASLIWRLPAHLSFDDIERGDPCEDINGERGRLGLMDVEYLARSNSAGMSCASSSKTLNR